MKLSRTTRAAARKGSQAADTSARVSDFKQAAYLAQLTSGYVLRSQLPVMAAALAYRTIFGIIPVIVIGLVVLGAFASDEQVAGTVARLLKFTGLSEITVDGGSAAASSTSDDDVPSVPIATGAFDPKPDLAPPPDGAVSDAPASGGAVLKAGEPSATSDSSSSPPNAQPAKLSDSAMAAVSKELSPASAQRVDQWIAELVTRVRRIPLRAIGIVGVLALIYAAISMLVEVERAFNQIYRVPAGRSWGARVARYWTLLTLGTLGLFATFYVGEAFKGLIASITDGKTSAHELAQAVQQITQKAADGAAVSDTGVVLTVVGFAVTVCISTLMLFTIYMVVPNARVRPHAAAVGALIAAILWETGKWGFTQYIHYSASYSRLYGSLAILPLFLMWIYVTWIVVLLGLFISYSLQTYKDRPLINITSAPRAIVDPASILLVLGAVAQRFRQGKPAEATDVTELTGLDGEVAVAMLEQAIQAGVLHRVSGGSDRDSFALARPPEAISVTECLELGHRLTTQGREEAERASLIGGRTASSSPLSTVLEPLDAARLQAARGRTLADLLGPAPGTLVTAAPPAVAVAAPSASPSSSPATT